MRIRVLWSIGACLLWLSSATVGLAADRFVTIGTGGVTGVYYPTGGAISKLVNKKRDVYRLKVTAEATGASVFNINALRTGDMDFGISQSDKASQAWQGQEEWKDQGPQKELRSVLMLNAETVCLVASVSSGIKTCADLKGKVVAIGNPGSGTRLNSLDALSLCGLTIEDLGKAEGLKPAEAASMLQDGRIDAYFYTVGHPNGSLKEAVAGGTPVRFIAFPDVAPLQAKRPFYSNAIIPIRLYEGAENKEDVPTFGVRACLLTSAKVPDQVVYAIAKEVCDNLDQFRTLHPALADLKKEDLVPRLPIPMHPGALKYYKEAGLDTYVQPR
jgi:uncharacterized protein